MSSRAARTDAKYGVTTDYPYLGLHDACATGNVGLAKYALTHGQPVNSVLDGVLPLHAACSSGIEAVVKLLLEYGADPNAARLPRKRTTDKNKSHTIIGTTGSTPLHFAAANGHTHIVGLLLSHGALADRTDKRGVTPLQLAYQQGHQDVVNTLEAWIAIHPSPSNSAFHPPSPNRAKHHRDPCPPQHHHSASLDVDSPPQPPPNNEQRRPSLPDITQPPSGGSSRRPRSADGDSDGGGNGETYVRVGRGLRKLGSKGGLLSIFRKPSGDLVALAQHGHASKPPDADSSDSDMDDSTGASSKINTPTAYQTSFSQSHSGSSISGSPTGLAQYSPTAFLNSTSSQSNGSSTSDLNLPLGANTTVTPPRSAFRPRKGSEVLTHSPLATEWRRPELTPEQPVSPGRSRGSSFRTPSAGSSFLNMGGPSPRPRKGARPSTAGSRMETPPSSFGGTPSASNSGLLVPPDPRQSQSRERRDSLSSSSPGRDPSPLPPARASFDQVSSHMRTRSHDPRAQPRRSHTSLSLSSSSSESLSAPAAAEGEVRSHAQASALVAQTRAALLALPDDGGDGDLAERLALLGERVELEKRFARGEAQRRVWGLREEEKDALGSLAVQSEPRIRGTRRPSEAYAGPAVRAGRSGSTPSPRVYAARLPSTTPPFAPVRLPETSPHPHPPIALAIEPPESDSGDALLSPELPSAPLTTARARTPDPGDAGMWTGGTKLTRTVTAPAHGPGHARRESGGASGGLKQRLGGGLKRVFGKGK